MPSRFRSVSRHSTTATDSSSVQVKVVSASPQPAGIGVLQELRHTTREVLDSL